MKNPQSIPMIRAGASHKEKIEYLYKHLPPDVSCQVVSDAIGNADATCQEDSTMVYESERYWYIALGSVSQVSSFTDGIASYLTDRDGGYTAKEIQNLVYSLVGPV